MGLIRKFERGALALALQSVIVEADKYLDRLRTLDGRPFTPKSIIAAKEDLRCARRLLRRLMDKEILR